MNKSKALSTLAFLLAVIVSVAGLSGLWSVTNSGIERQSVLLLATLTVLVLLANSYAIRKWVFQQTQDRLIRRVASLCLLSLALCFGGDIINFNLTQSYYQHSDVVRHDYLADSVWFFAPGYLLLMTAALTVAHSRGVSNTVIITGLVVAALIGAGSFASIHLTGTGTYVSALTGFYSVLITAVGVSGALLLLSFGLTNAPPMAWLVSLGLVLAAVADAVIGSFWLYGNNGEGFYPAVRDINWVIYIGSQSLVIHLPRLAALYPIRGSVSAGIDR